MKKVIALLLAILVALSLFGCSDSKQSGGNTTGKVSDNAGDNSGGDADGDGAPADGQDKNVSGKAVIFEPIADDVSALRDSDVYEAAAVLEKRLDRAGYENFEKRYGGSDKTIKITFENPVTREEMEELITPPRKINIRNAAGDVIMTSDNVSMSSSHVTYSSNDDGYEDGVQHITLLLIKKVDENECDSIYMDDTLISQNITEVDDSTLRFDVECTEEEAASKALVTEIYEGSRYPVRIVSIED